MGAVKDWYVRAKRALKAAALAVMLTAVMQLSTGSLTITTGCAAPFVGCANPPAHGIPADTVVAPLQTAE
jgi:hypothetical protein